MSTVDAVIFGVAAVAAVGGWRFGFLPRLLAWGGVGLGLVIAVPLVPPIVTAFGGTSPDTRVTAALAFLVLTAMVGHGIGLALGGLVRRMTGAQLPKWDKGAGAILGVLGVLVLVWMTTPSFAAAPGWPARAARDSWIVDVVDSLGPDQPDRFAVWGREIAEAPYPFALDPLSDPGDVGAAPTAGLTLDVDARVRPSIVKVSGFACDRVQEGSGWVARPGIVVTNAHVVAGERDTEVTDVTGRRHDAAVVAFDPTSDLAVLAAPSLGAPALALARGDVDTEGAVYGHPGGGPLTASPARVAERITAVGTDIYRTSDSRRDVYVLAAALEPGDSGGALVDQDGRVIGTAFAIDPGRAGVAYALTRDEIDRVLESVSPLAVDPGPCLVD
ncbi:MAG TPA: MarP family serine protease [Acidimicrobiia bacterium]|nr:MarP family serine protease [Acidimicrobiia bacterium]